MHHYLFIVFFLIVSLCSYAQQTKVVGKVTDAVTGEILPFVKVSFQDSKIGTMTDSTGNYVLESYYATDSIQFFQAGYAITVKAVKKDIEQQIDAQLGVEVDEIDEVVVRPPDELPSTRLHKKVIANKDINNKEKLDAYGYEAYNKIQLDLNNIGDKLIQSNLAKPLSLVMKYLDSTDEGKTFLPVILSENISEFHYQNSPKRRKETVSATRVTGVENLQFDQFLGDLYLDFNIYDNYIVFGDRSFVSPVANFARTYYRFYLEDSMFIDNDWCYKLRFKPKRSGDATFEGEMWINDTTYAVKSYKASISPGVNINYIQDLYMEQHFDQVEKEVWMLTEEKFIIDLKVTKNSKLYGFYGRKYASRKNFKINTQYQKDFFKTENTVVLLDSAKLRDDNYWKAHRHIPLSVQEEKIDIMIDTLNKTRFFRFLKTATYMLSTGYYPAGKLEYGSVHALIAVNQVEKFRTGIAIRTSNDFSRRFEIGGKIYYGFGDERFKYGGKIRYIITPKKRGLFTFFYNYDIEQIGLAANAAAVNSTVSTLLKTGPLDKLTFVSKGGFSIEKDVSKDFILFGGIEWKEYVALGKADYERYDDFGSLERVSKLQTAEVTARIRWCKSEEFIGGAFDRTSITSKYPAISIQAVFGIKGIQGSDYDYQRIEFSYDHSKAIGVLGNLRYGINSGVVIGTVAYPFLKVHEGSQSYFLNSSAFNKMAFYEFISDRYVGGYLEQHFVGLIFDRIPLIKKLQWRLVASARATYGAVDKRHNEALLIPTFTKKFTNTPYTELSVGVENIFKFGRVDLVYRLNYLDAGMNPLGVRIKFAFYF